jgi:glycosyltransferase involved in cell wall biosynthesis
MEKKVVIVSYTFPPSHGIGGRRWAKFAKYLNRNGAAVKILTFSTGDGSNWNHDVSEYKNLVDKLDPKQPFYLLNSMPDSVFSKIWYRVTLYLAQIKFSGNVYDPALMIKSQLFKYLDERLKEGYCNVIVSGAPFHLTYYASLFKKKHPEINLILDYRDPWTTNEMGYQFKDMSKKRQVKEKEIENSAIANADYVYTVNDTMSAYFESISPPSTVVRTIKNGFDDEDFEKSELPNGVNNEKIKLVYTGNLYDNIDYIFVPLMNVIKGMSKEEVQRFEFNFYGGYEERYKKIVDQFNLGDTVRFYDFISLPEVFNKIRESDCALLFLTKDLKDSFSTKFYEYLSQRKFIVVFSEMGETGRFIEKNKLGISIQPEFISDKLNVLIQLKEEKNIEVDTSFDVNQYSVKSITKLIEEDLK